VDPLSRRTVAIRVLKRTGQTFKSWVGGIQWWVKLVLFLPVVGAAGLTVVGWIPRLLVGVGILMVFFAAFGEAIYQTVCDGAGALRSAHTQPREDDEARAHRERLAVFVGSLRLLNLSEVASLEMTPEVQQLGEHIGRSTWGAHLFSAIKSASAIYTLERDLAERVRGFVEAQASIHKLGADATSTVVQWTVNVAQFGDCLSFHTERESDGLLHVYLEGRPGFGHIAATSERQSAAVRRTCVRLYTQVKQWPEWAEASSGRRAALEAWARAVDDRPDRDVLRNWLRHGECDACRRDLPRIAA